MDAEKQLQRLLARAQADAAVLAVVLFGSRARGDARPDSDVDVCLVLEPAVRDAAAQARTLLDHAMHVDLDVHVFQRLPLYVRHRVLKEGKVLFARDEDRLYEVAFRTARAFESFRPRYRLYLEEVARARS